MIKVLQILDSLDLGGIQAFLMNVYRHIDREKVHFDFLVFRPHTQRFESEIFELGGTIYKLPGRSEGIFKLKAALRRFFKEHPEYGIVHYHTSSLSNIEPLIAAARAGVPKRIIHCHSTRAASKIHTALHYWNSNKIVSLATDYLSCGEKAADWLYKNKKCREKAVVVYNGVYVESYRFNAAVREEVRRELKLPNDAVVYGHVGRFGEPKNHLFLISIFNELKKKDANSVLILVGDGPLRPGVEAKVQELGLTQDARFLGNRSDVNRLLQAFDVFLMPSLYEGFPVAAIEAEAAGLPCYISDSVTKEALINENARAIGLDRSPEEWADEILKGDRRRVDGRAVVDAGFDVQATVDYLSRLYS